MTEDRRQKTKDLRPLNRRTTEPPNLILNPPDLHVIPGRITNVTMATLEELYDDAMFDFSKANYDAAIEKLKSVLEQDDSYFDAQLSLGMAYYRKGEYAEAIAHGHQAETMRPNEQLVHTNLSLFYMKSGDKEKAEHHGLQARIASWKGNMAAPSAADESDPDLKMAAPKTQPFKTPQKFPDMPWKKKDGGKSE